MEVINFIKKLRAKGIRLGVCAGKIQYDAPRGVMLQDDIAVLKDNMPNVITFLQDEGAAALLPVNEIILGDSLEKLKGFPSNSVDALITDPPYGYSFMGKDWDKAIPSVEFWKEVHRVLKPGAFACIMSAPRQDVLWRMMANLESAGFNIRFSSLYWTYAGGFPKARNMSMSIDKKMGAKREVTGERLMPNMKSGNYGQGKRDYSQTVVQDTKPATAEAQQFDGSYAGFQPKPAVEVILVAMKPLGKKTYTEQALANGKGITWMDDCRIPYGDEKPNIGNRHKHGRGDGYGFKPPWQQKGGVKWSPEREWKQDIVRQAHEKGRFPANFLVSDGVLSGGKESQRKGQNKDAGSYSRFFSLDAWAERNLPFLIVPKAGKKEKNIGLGEDENIHPTVKPLKLMAYLITLFSRPGDVILDPFCGSGTTCIAADMLGLRFIGIEMNEEYREIALKRLEYAKSKKEKVA